MSFHYSKVCGASNLHSTYLFSGENDRKSPDFHIFILAVLGHTDEALYIQKLLVPPTVSPVPPAPAGGMGGMQVGGGG